MVGIFVLAGIAAVAYLSLSVGGGIPRPGREALKLFAAFDETGSLAVRAPVVIAGVRVGEVTRISLNKNFRADVELRLRKDMQLPADTSAAIVTAGVLGDRYIELQPGGDEKMLKSGDTITFTESAVILEKLIGQFIYGKTKENQTPAATGPAKTPSP
jgi:phospholipid/cholesterol/gamma-HCH transport system substrate-binding protein